MNKLYLDFETFYDVGYSLTKMTTAEYVHSPEFKVWGVGVKWNDDIESEWYNFEEIPDLFAQYDWDELAVVCHNTLFDAYILTQIYHVFPKYYYDTAAMSRGLYPNESAALKNVCVRLFPTDSTLRKGEELVTAKGIRDLDPELEVSIAGYCIQDVDLTYAIFKKMEEGSHQSELDLIDMTVRMFVEPQLTLDRELVIQHKEQIATETAQKIEDSGTTREILASQPKFAAHIESLGVTVPTKKSPRTGEMIPAFSKNDSAYVQMIKAYPEHQAVWDGREAVKSRIEETRAERFLSAVNPDGTVSVPLRYYAAHTGRFGGSEKINLQNLPRGSKLRSALQAAPGNLLYVADLSNIEARMLAWLANEESLLMSFAAGEDVYSKFASEIYNRPITKANKLERYVGKTAILGLGYGMGKDRYQDTLKNGSPSVDVTENTALTIVSQYRAMYPNIPRLWNRCKEFLYTMLDPYSVTYGPLNIVRNAIELPNGMYLKYPHLTFTSGEFLYQSSTNKSPIRTHGPRLCENIVQALARIVITNQMLRIKQELSALDVVLTVHDEIICSGPEEEAEFYLNEIMSIMKNPPEWCETLPLDAEGGYSKVYDK